jgi:hypothetical protein
MRRLEQAHRAARDHHINRHARMGAHRSVMRAVGIIDIITLSRARLKNEVSVKSAYWGR